MWRDASSPDPIFTDTLSSIMLTVEPSLAGPKRPQDRVALSPCRKTFASELPKLRKPVRAKSRSPVKTTHERRPCRDRGDHQLHQHLEPVCADGGRIAGPQCGGQGHEGQAVGQNLAGAW